MKRPPLFESNCFRYWKNRFETYVKSKDIDLWYIIVYGNYKPTIKDKDGKDQIVPYEKFDENQKKIISKNDEAKIILYNALPKKEYERIFMCDTARDIWNSLTITHQALDESFLIRNHVRKFLRSLPTKWRPKVTAIEESKDLSKLSLDELIGNLKKKVSSNEEASCSSSDEEYAMAVRDFKKFFKRTGKFVHQPHDDKKNFQKVKEDKKEKEDRRCFNNSEEDSKKDEICLMALDNNEVLSDTPYYSSSSLDNESLQNKYDKLCKISLRLINKNKHLKSKNEALKNEACELRKQLEQLKSNKDFFLKCESCVNLKSKVSSLSLKLASFKNSSVFLQEMLEKQKPPKDKHKIGFTEYIASTSDTKTKKLSPIDNKMPTVELASPVPSTREPASSVEQNRLTAGNL
ncbi:hypothetical protein Tco_1105067 [Tanacetum coccineum]